MVKIQLSAATNVGVVRTNNEDNFIVSPDLSQDQWTLPSAEPIELGTYGAMLVVADGMGGTNAGEVASAIAVETVQKQFGHEKLTDLIDETDEEKRTEAIKKFMTKAVKTANENIIEHSKKDAATSGMGTTIVMAWILGTTAYICWCGDSRCYVFNPDTGLCRLSKDHSYVQELVDSGKLDAENAFDHPNSNIITRCLGDGGAVCEPDFRTYSLNNGDVLLLCTDGLCGLCRDEEIMGILNESSATDLPACKDALIQAALDAGGYDNVTLVLCRSEIENEADTDKPAEISSTIDDVRKKKKGRALRWFFIFLVAVVVVVVVAVVAWLIYHFLYLKGNV